MIGPRLSAESTLCPATAVITEGDRMPAFAAGSPEITPTTSAPESTFSPNCAASPASGFLGVEVRNLEAGEAAQLGLNVDSGALVVGVISGLPAAKAGIRSPSVITAVAGHKVDSADNLGPIIYQYKPGQQVSVTWVDTGGT